MYTIMYISVDHCAHWLHSFLVQAEQVFKLKPIQSDVLSIFAVFYFLRPGTRLLNSENPSPEEGT